MERKEIETFAPSTPQEWRRWLEENHQKEEAVCLIMNKKGSGKPVINWTDAVDHALCFGWIDGKRKPIDGDSFMQFYTRRKPRGTWSKINKEKIIRLIDEGLMTQAGLEVIERAKQNGSWEILDEIEEMIMPSDLKEALESRSGAMANYTGFSRSSKKSILYWLASAKRPETRQKRREQIVDLAAENLKPVQFR